MLRASNILKTQVKLALIQLASGPNKSKNLQHAREKVLEAGKAGANIVVLPECFNSPYGTQYFAEYAESIASKASESYKALSAMAKDSCTYLVGGSIPEFDESTNKYFNTSLTFSPEGDLLATHRKIHLFDIDVPGKIKFTESDVLSGGSSVTIVDTAYGKIGVAICYDVRFPELAMIAQRRGCFAMIYPGAFNLTTGPLHWQLLARGRAVDNQIYVAQCSPARDMNATYHAWGHSMVVDPMGEVLKELEHEEDTVVVDLKPEVIDETRQSIPVTTQRRFDVYLDVSDDARIKSSAE